MRLSSRTREELCVPGAVAQSVADRRSEGRRVATSSASQQEVGTSARAPRMVGVGEDCECEWERLEDGKAWAGSQMFVTLHPIESADQCELACCYRKLGCQGYTYTAPDQICKLFAGMDGNREVDASGARSGTNSGGHNCPPPADVDPNHPPVPFLYDLEQAGPGWAIVGGLLCCAVLYLLVGTVLSRGRLPNREFWGNLRGLLRDGLSFAAGRGGAGPAGESIQQAGENTPLLQEARGGAADDAAFTEAERLAAEKQAQALALRAEAERRGAEDEATQAQLEKELESWRHLLDLFEETGAAEAEAAAARKAIAAAEAAAKRAADRRREEREAADAAALTAEKMSGRRERRRLEADAARAASERAEAMWATAMAQKRQRTDAARAEEEAEQAQLTKEQQQAEERRQTQLTKVKLAEEQLAAAAKAKAEAEAKAAKAEAEAKEALAAAKIAKRNHERRRQQRRKG